jgi:hypothetical protein
MPLIIFGAILFASALTVDAFFRLRILKAGDRSVLWKAGSFDYQRYHDMCAKSGWSHWPVYGMWALYILGIGFAIIGALLQVGALRGLWSS